MNDIDGVCFINNIDRTSQNGWLSHSVELAPIIDYESYWKTSLRYSLYEYDYVINDSSILLNESCNVKRTVWESASKLLPSENIELGNVLCNQIPNSSYTNSIYFDVKPCVRERTVALISDYDNLGEALLIPLVGLNLYEIQGVLSTMIRITELFLSVDDPKSNMEIELIYDKTGFPINTIEGYRNFVNQYITYFSNFSSLQNGQGYVSSDYQSIIDTGCQTRNWAYKTIRIARKSSKDSIVFVDAALDDFGRLNREFVVELVRLLKERYTNPIISCADLHEMNSIRLEGFNDARYFAENGSCDWRFIKYPSYNTFIKNYLLTNITYFKNPETEDGTFVDFDRRGRERLRFQYLQNGNLQYNFPKQIS